MKTRFLFTLITMGTSLMAQEVKNVDSRIEAVTLFRAGAQVTRSATVPLKKGEQTIIFENIALGLRESSLQVIQDPSSNIAIHDMKHEVQYLNPSLVINDTLSLLAAQSQKLDEDLKQLKGSYRVNVLSEKNLMENSDFTSSKSRSLPLEESLRLFEQRLKKLQAERLSLEKRIRENERQQQILHNALLLKRLEQGKATGQLHVSLSAPAAKNYLLKISYFVQEAGWNPQYDLKMTETTDPLEIIYTAEVFQATGEDWQNIMISLSNAEPKENLERPALKPFQVGNLSYNRGGVKTKSIYTPTGHTGKISGLVYHSDNNVPMANASVIAYNASNQVVAATATNATGAFTLNVKGRATLLVAKSTGYKDQSTGLSSGKRFYELDFSPPKQVSVTTAEDIQSMAVRDISSVASQATGVSSFSSNSSGNTYFYNRPENVGLEKKKELYTYGEFNTQALGTNVSFSVAQPFSLLADGRSRNLNLRAIEQPATFEYLLIPKAQSYGYLVAAVDQWEALQLQEGRANIYINGTYLGHSLIIPNDAEDTLRLNMGSDERVYSKRALIKKEKRTPVFSSNHEEVFSYELTLHNLQEDSLEVRVMDQVPVSKSEAIEITLLDAERAKHNKESGTLEWQLTLPPRQSTKLRFSYQISYPKGVNINH